MSQASKAAKFLRLYFMTASLVFPQKGCKFKILLLYPSSDNLLVKCLQNSHRNLNHIEGSMRGEFLYFKTLADNLSRTSNIVGEIEIKIQKDIYSAICYFSTKDNRSNQDFMAFIWMYIFNSRGLEYPAFEILDDQLLENAECHFEHLWSKSYSILKYNQLEKNNQLAEILK